LDEPYQILSERYNLFIRTIDIYTYTSWLMLSNYFIVETSSLVIATDIALVGVIIFYDS